MDSFDLGSFGCGCKAIDLKTFEVILRMCVILGTVFEDNCSDFGEL
jgi:hypothetical protein